MANDEISYQTEIIKATEAAGGAGFKLSNSVLVGIPDLELVLPGKMALKAECKFIAAPPTFRRKSVTLSMPQENFMWEWRKATGLVVWWIGFKASQGVRNRPCWGTVVRTIHQGSKFTLTREMITKQEPLDGLFIKYYGEPWPIEEIMDFSLQALGMPTKIDNSYRIG